MKKAVFLSILFVVMLSIVPNTSLAQNEQNSYQKLLRKAIIERPLGRAGIFDFLSWGAGPNVSGPRFVPIIGLRNPNAVPFLINILQNGPDWSDDELPMGKANMYRYVARCYAALCLGSIGDSRALDPLLVVLNDTEIEPYKYGDKRTRSGEYNLRAQAAFALGDLGDHRAVKPLIKSLKQDGFAECIYALTKLQEITAVPIIVQVASDRNMFRNLEIHHCLENMLQVRFTFRTEGEDYRYKVIDQFPEIGIVHLENRYQTLWQHWLKVGDRYARERFEEYYPQWKAALKDKPNAHSLHSTLQEKMLKGGVAAIPYLIAEIEKGDDALIPVASELTRPRVRRTRDLSPKLSENATRTKALEWWKKNKKKWTVFQSEIPDE